MNTDKPNLSIVKNIKPKKEKLVSNTKFIDSSPLARLIEGTQFDTCMVVGLTPEDDLVYSYATVDDGVVTDTQIMFKLIALLAEAVAYVSMDNM